MDIVAGVDGHPLFSALQQATSAAPDAPAPAKKAAVVSAPTDVLELPSGALVVTVDVPGASRGDVKVHVEDGKQLVISGEQRRAADDDEGVEYLRTERRVGKFVRKFPLPETANLDSVSASYKHGVLTVKVERMPPPPERKNRKIIEVKAG